MRKITIHQDQSNSIEVYDDSNEELDNYCSRLAELMKVGSIAILKSSSSSVILRPSKVVGIEVEDVISAEETLPTLPPEEIKEEPEIVEDIITDVDA